MGRSTVGRKEKKKIAGQRKRILNLKTGYLDAEQNLSWGGEGGTEKERGRRLINRRSSSRTEGEGQPYFTSVNAMCSTKFIEISQREKVAQKRGKTVWDISTESGTLTENVQKVSKMTSKTCPTETKKILKFKSGKFPKRCLIRALVSARK